MKLDFSILDEVAKDEAAKDEAAKDEITLDKAAEDVSKALVPSVKSGANDTPDASLCPTEFRTDYMPLKPTFKEISGDLNTQVLKQELQNYDVYLHNIHNGFKSVSSVMALSRLVRDGLAVNRQRRASIEHAINMQSGAIRYSITGDLLDD